MHKNILLALAILLLGLNTVSANTDSAAIFRELGEIELLIKKDYYDSASYYLMEVSEKLRKNPKPELECFKLFCKARLYDQTMHSKDAVLALNQAILIMEGHHSTNHALPTAHFALGEVLYKLKLYELALEQYQIALKDYKYGLEKWQYPRPEIIFRRHYEAIRSMGMIYNFLEQFDSAMLYHQQAVAMIADTLYTRTKVGAYSTIADAYLQAGSPDSAAYFYRKSFAYGPLEITRAPKHYSQLLDKMGEYFENTMQLDSAVHYRQLQFEFKKSIGADTLVNGAKLMIAYLKAGKINEALQLKQELDLIYDPGKTGNRAKEYWFKALLHFDDNIIAPAKKLLYLDSFMYFNEFHIDRDHDRANFVFQNLMQDQSTWAQERLQNERDKAAIVVQKSRTKGLIIALVIVVAVFIVAIIVMLYRRRLAVAAEKAEKLRIQKEMEAERMQKEIEFKQKDVSNLALTLSNERKANEKIMKRLEAILSSAELEKNMKSLILEINQQNQNQEENTALLTKIEEVNARFYHVLSEKYPALTKNEREFCGLVKVGLGNQEIANLKNIAYGSVQKAKTRIKSKMALGAEDDLYAHVVEF